MYFWILSLMALNFHPPEIQGVYGDCHHDKDDND